jgi:hypothetical protein
VVFGRSEVEPKETLAGLLVSRAVKHYSVRFPRYAMTLSLAKSIRLRDIDYGIVVTATFVGGGSALLLVALARAGNSRQRAGESQTARFNTRYSARLRNWQHARDHALEASRVKSEFLASMSDPNPLERHHWHCRLAG